MVQNVNKVKILLLKTRTEIQGGPWGHGPLKVSVVATVNLYSFIILLFQNIE